MNNDNPKIEGDLKELKSDLIQTTELDKAIERLENEMQLEHHDTGSEIPCFRDDIRKILLAAKRLKEITDITGIDGKHLQFSLQLLTRAEKAEKRARELEKENAEFRRTEPLKKQECNYWRELVFSLIGEFPHSEEETEGEVIKRMIQSLQQLSQLRTENQEMSVELGENAKAIFELRTEYKKALEALNAVMDDYGSLRSGKYESSRMALKVIGTPSAIAAMKGEV